MDIQLIDFWKEVDPLITTALAATLTTLTLAAASFLTTWIPVKEKEVSDAASDINKQQRKNKQLLCAKNGVKQLLIAFCASAFLLVQSVVIDPLGVVDDIWNYGDLADFVTAEASLGIAVIWILRSAINIYQSIDTNG